MNIALIVIAVALVNAGDVYVGPAGNDTQACGAEIATACRSIAYAFNQSPAPELVLLTGNYTESQPVVIGANQSLGITGQNKTGSIVSKNASDLVLFNLISANSNLTLFNLTLLLTTHTESFPYISSIGVNVSVFVNINSCRISLQTGLNQIYGQSILISNSMAAVALINCTVYNITSTTRAIICSTLLKSLLLKDSSFVNVNNSNVNGSGGCFHVEATANVTLIRDIFSLCSSGNTAGVGYLSLTASGSLIDTCTFVNTTAPNYGALQILGDFNRPTINIFNTSCIDCTATDVNATGGAFFLNHYLKPNVTSCTFTGCASQGAGSYGGALYITNYVDAVVDRCTFLGCGAQYGSAVYVTDMSSLILTNSVLLNNTFNNGTHVHVNASTNFTTTNSFSDGNPALYCNETNSTSCNGTLSNRALYNAATCANNFTAPGVINGYCNMPCAASNGTCLKPDACPANHIAVNGMCVLTCSYWKPVLVGVPPLAQTLTCPSSCSVDTTQGYPVCVIECTQRLLNVSALFPCGSSTCYFDSAASAVAGQQCLAQCVANYHHTGVGQEGVCTLRECTARTKNRTAALLCGSSDCFGDGATPNPGDNNHCISGCVDDDYHSGVAENGTCQMKDCINRTAKVGVENVTYPCGSSDCLYDENMTAQAGKTCVFVCAYAHYQTQFATASCTLKPCTGRFLNESTPFPCATEDCFYDPFAPDDRQCVTQCPTDNLHTGEHVNGRCVMTPCVDRVPNTTALHFCGSSDCFFDPQPTVPPSDPPSGDAVGTGTPCTPVCVADTLHAGVVTDEVCRPRTCLERIADPTADQPCVRDGDRCYFNPTAPALEGMQCLPDCSEDGTNNHLSGEVDQQTQTCLLKPCPHRLMNSSTIFPCGSSDCLHNTQINDVVGQQCGLSCDQSGYEPDFVTGICVTRKEAPVAEDPAAAKSKKQAKAGVTLGIVALVLAIVALAGLVALVLYCWLCGRKGGYENVDSLN